MIDVAGAVQTPQKPCSWLRIDDAEPSPSGRAAHGVAQTQALEGHEKFYIFGGLGQFGCLNDLWEFDISSKSWKKLTSENEAISPSSNKIFEPSPRFGAAMTYIHVEKETGDNCNYLVVFGGMNSSGEIFNDLWVYKIPSR